MNARPLEPRYTQPERLTGPARTSRALDPGDGEVDAARVDRTACMGGTCMPSRGTPRDRSPGRGEGRLRQAPPSRPTALRSGGWRIAGMPGSPADTKAAEPRAPSTLK